MPICCPARKVFLESQIPDTHLTALAGPTIGCEFIQEMYCFASFLFLMLAWWHWKFKFKCSYSCLDACSTLGQMIRVFVGIMFAAAESFAVPVLWMGLLCMRVAPYLECSVNDLFPLGLVVITAGRTVSWAFANRQWCCRAVCLVRSRVGSVFDGLFRHREGRKCR